MGSASSKPEKIDVLRLCKERKRFIQQAIDSRYSLAAAHLSYIESLKNIGISLRRFAQSEVSTESSLDKSPSHSSYHPSPSSPFHNAPSPPVINVSYMKSGGGVGTAVTVKVKLQDVENSVDGFDEDDMLGFSIMPPPPPPFTGSWDYFDTNSEHCESFRFVAHNDDLELMETSRVGGVGSGVIDAKGKWVGVDLVNDGVDQAEGEAAVENKMEGSSPEEEGNDGEDRETDSNGSSTEKTAAAEREDPSEFITHRAKDFISSIKEIEHRFFRASESGKEVSRMLEANNIRVGYSQAKGRSPALAILEAFNLVCCQGRIALVSNEPAENGTKVITWKRTTSSKSSSSRNPLTNGAKDDASESGSDFFEEFCMISGSHSSTLDRLYAWERKLYDEVKASESIRKEYDHKCDKLRHQFAKDHSTQLIDKTRSAAKDLHSRIRVAIHSVDSISKRIEKMRDEELHPQLLELVHGFIRMWKAMLECHHAQYITISLAYHSRATTATPRGDTRREMLSQLLQEIECFGLGFTNWVNSHTSYVEALNGWLQHCIIQPQERSKNRRPFSPRRVVAPPIFVLCRDWSVGIKALPSEELNDSIKSFLSEVRQLMHQRAEPLEKNANGELETRDIEKSEDASVSLSCIHTSLTKVLDRLNKFSEASLKMYEDIRQKSEAARVAYSTCRPIRF